MMSFSIEVLREKKIIEGSVSVLLEWMPFGSHMGAKEGFSHCSMGVSGIHTTPIQGTLIQTFKYTMPCSLNMKGNNLPSLFYLKIVLLEVTDRAFCNICLERDSFQKWSHYSKRINTTQQNSIVVVSLLQWQFTNMLSDNIGIYMYPSCPCKHKGNVLWRGMSVILTNNFFFLPIRCNDFSSL